MVPLSAPWLLRWSDDEGEVRWLARSAGADAAPADGVRLLWRCRGGVESELPARWIPTRLGEGVRCAAFALRGLSAGGSYRMRCAGLSTPWIEVAVDPISGSWRFLLLSDHQQMPGVRGTLRAIEELRARAPVHGVLFAGDLVAVPDDLDCWCGAANGLAFLDTLAAPAAALFAPAGDDRAARGPGPLLSSVPLWACPGNHEVSCRRLDLPPLERFLSVEPRNWDIETFAALCLPVGSPGWYRARVGPLEIASLFVARRYARGDHRERSGPCYEPPGRFLFESPARGSRQHRWMGRLVAGETGAAGGGAHRDVKRGPARLQVTLLHHPPFSQGHDALPLFGEPVEYRENLIARDLVPLLAARGGLVLCGHNHIVNHHRVDGVDYLESSHMAGCFPAFGYDAEGRPLPEPLGHPASYFAAEEAATFFSILEVPDPAAEANGPRRGDRAPRAIVHTYSIGGDGAARIVYTFAVGA